jgi:hypothetical protein
MKKTIGKDRHFLTRAISTTWNQRGEKNEEKEKNSEKKEENRNREGEKENSSQKRIEEKIMGGKKR